MINHDFVSGDATAPTLRTHSPQKRGHPRGLASFKPCFGGEKFGTSTIDDYILRRYHETVVTVWEENQLCDSHPRTR